MEDTHGDLQGMLYKMAGCVLILIVMEDTHGDR